ncbi:MAG: DUF6279 family lipoprotein [Burkholderiaceae bacterium]
MVRRLAAAMIVLSLASLLAGCSALRIGYGNGETVAYWWLNGYVDIDQTQRPWVRKRIDDWFAWHRRSELPDYARLLAAWRGRLTQPRVGEAEVLQAYADVRARTLRGLDRALPGLAELALSLRPEQIDHVEKKFAANDDKFRREYLGDDREALQEARYRKALKQAEYWFGDFSREQRATIRAASNARPLDPEAVLAERRRRQAAFVALLRRIRADRPPPDKVEALLREQFVAALDHAGGDPQRRAFFDASQEGSARFAATVINLATPAQKTHAAKVLQEWIDDLNRMATGAAGGKT